ncbi:A/G-specific adenine glycosylase [Steroidobacter denitrificans]|uniref:Adenine DNA glycosylase n=1 Tax=Steroidobacter denitrificans TaxID=465721 RepID=A0A127FC16_STEDE|nr:A/G-specific adenine glycosylase [Steroidobacter denitrificans]AMN47972.1 A/G-specific adenine glycosylase [Steroidobacter denitrificans]
MTRAALPAEAAERIVFIGKHLLRWFEIAGRKHLPWQHRPSAYRVWISEVMLQQTQVATVIPYYERFMARFPDVQSLAAAEIDEVLHLWTGLGYYARARNLHRAAQRIVAEHRGRFPETLQAVQSLPGIGRSTAGAILALSASKRHAILDGNVKRVLCRYFGIEGFPGESDIERHLWRLAEACTPVRGVARYTQAIMDLGATVCVRTRPDCAACPLHLLCVARIEARQSVLPTPRPKKPRPRRRAYALILQRRDGAVLLERRPPSGLWGGLWTFPQFDTRRAAAQWAANAGPVTNNVLHLRALAPYAHAFTHFDLSLRPLLIRVGERPGVADLDRYRWYHAHRPAKIGLAKPVIDLLAALP